MSEITTVDQLGLPNAVRNALCGSGIYLVSQLVQLSYEDLLDLDRVGSVSVAAIAERLNALGLPPLKYWKGEMSATIHELPKATLADVPRVLRAIAQEIEDGLYGTPVSAVVVLEADEIHTFGAGAADHYRALGLLFRGQKHIAEKAE